MTHDLRIVRAAAGYDDFFAACREALDPNRDGGRGQTVAVVIRSGSEVLESSNRRTNWAPYCSRPADFGGFSL
jgi:hypothetical protein